MPVARKQIVDPKVTPWYHCISRCVRRAFLCGGGGNAHRKDWIEASKELTPSYVSCRTRLEFLFHGTLQAAYKKARLEFLSQVFAVNVGAFSAMDNHLHVLLRLDREQAESLSAEEVARRWGVLRGTKTVR